MIGKKTCILSIEGMVEFSASIWLELMGVSNCDERFGQSLADKGMAFTWIGRFIK